MSFTPNNMGGIILFADAHPLSTITTNPVANTHTYLRVEAMSLLESVTRTRNLIHCVPVGV